MGVARYRKPDVLRSIPLDRPAVIEASAGTGKTFTLEHLVLELLLVVGVRLEEILVVTFTEKATTELRMRIRAKLEELLHWAKDAGDAPDEQCWILDDGAREKLARAVSALDAAPISTIHAFCQRVLTEHAFSNRRLFGQTQVDGAEAFSLAFREALRAEFAREEELRAYLAAWLGHCGSLEDLEKLLRSCARARGRLVPPLDADLLLGRAREVRFEPAFREALRVELKAARVHARTVTALLDRLERLDALLAACRERAHLPALLVGWQAWRADGGSVAGQKTDALRYTTHHLQAAAPAKNAVLAAERLRAWSDAAVSFTAAIVSRFLPVVSQRLDRRKRDLGLFDFDDMLGLVHESVAADEAGDGIVAALRRRYRYALIDEFQDTEDVQWEIFERVFQRSGGANIPYLIGDPKQAIYRFRGADVYTYLRARDEIADGGGERVPLVANYRSTADMIEACNLVFSHDTPRPFFTGDNHYDHPVTCGDPARALIGADGTQPPPVVLLHVATREGFLLADDARNAAAARVADEIAALLDPARRPPVYREKGKDRPIRPGDIYVLTFTGKEGHSVGEALRARGVPHAFYKQEGLLQTEEARHVRDLLLAVVDPHDRSLRARAWLTPFFALTLEELARTEGVDAAHPLVTRLLEWKALADGRDLARLFGRILGDSGIVRREIVLSGSERALTNYLHLFELLLEQSGRQRESLAELVQRFSAWVDEHRPVPGEDGNLQRLETDRDAVQIMTVHKSKGLEAPVVFLTGGFGDGKGDGLHVFHDAEGKRCVFVGPGAPADVQAEVDRESDEERQRLLYVALTRAKARLYLPYFGRISREEATRAFGPDAPDPDQAGSFPRLGGTYRLLHRRLTDLVDGGGAEVERLFRREVVGWPPASPAGAVAAETATGELAAPPDDPGPPLAGELAALAKRHSGFVVTSYSRLRPSHDAAPATADVGETEAETPIGAAAEAPADDDLPGGTTMGVFLHEVIELAPLESFDRARDYDAWRALPEVRDLLARQARLHGIDNRHLPRASRLVHTALTSAVPLGDGETIPGIRTAKPLLREAEFLYPIPEREHPRQFEPLAREGFLIRRGYVKGVMDAVFTWRGRSYFGDWKSDRLPRFDTATLTAHVEANYSLQAKLYALALVRMLGVRSEEHYEQRFGGLLYLFLRGMEPGTPGRAVYSHRPSWSEVLSWEEEIVNDERWGLLSHS